MKLIASIAFVFLFTIGSGYRIWAQERMVRGTVTSRETGDVLAGVTVTIKGRPAQAVQTDEKGSFELRANPGDRLIISYTGMETQELTVGTAAYLAIGLARSTRSQDSVIVIGYGTLRKRELSTSVATVGAKALDRQVVGSFENALQGQASGVQVTNPSGTPGSAISISIRGKNSVSLSTSPLYVIDGVPVQPEYDQEVGFGNQRPNPLSTINTSDIESIDILKDGASAAIYGSRASNGVVVITTKRGRSGHPQVNFSSYLGQQDLRKKIALLNGKQWAAAFNDSRLNAGQAAAYNPDTVTTNTNWQDLVYRKAHIRNYQLGVQGGTEKTKYYFSGNYFDQDGIVLNSGFKRYSAKINLDQTVTDQIRIGASVNLSTTKNNRSVRSESALNNAGVLLGAIEQIPTMPVYKADGSYALNPFSQSDNPYGNLLESHDLATISQVFGNAYGEWDILKSLTFRTSIGIDYRSQLESQYNSRELPSTENSPSASRGSASVGTNMQTIWLWENTLTFRPQLPGEHHLTVLAGYSAQNSDRYTTDESGFGFPSDAVPYLFAASTRSNLSSYEDQWGLISYYSRANYNYKGRYYVSASIRADGSSRFASGRRFGYFPAVSAAWDLSRESFFEKHSGALSELKLRGSFGANGNQDIGIYDRYSTFGTGYNYTNYTGDGSVAGGIAPNRIGNARLKWETTNQFDAGLDLGLWQGRVTLTFDAYLKKTRNLLTNVPLSYSSGAEAGSGSNATITQNLGEVQNKGLELGINSTNIRTSWGLTWSTQVNVSLNRNEVTNLGTLTDAGGKASDRRILGGYSITEKGQPLGAFYGYVVEGIFQSPAEITAAASQPNAKPGDLHFADLNGDKVIDEKDRRVIGNPNPKYIGGITNTVTYRGLEFSFLLQGSFGNDIYNQNRTLIENMGYPFNQSVDALNRWTHAGQNTSFPREVLGDPNSNARFSTRYVEKGTYGRLKNVTLGYTVMDAWLKRVGIGSVRLYVTGQNLLTFTHYKGYDPEVNADPLNNIAFGRDYGVYPQPRVFTGGISIQF